MELRQLRYLLAIADEGNFTRAAEKVFVSQSALSQQIQTLEQQVGTLLLDRSRQGVRLTTAGEILAHHARRVFLELGQARIAIEELEGLKRGELRVGCVQTVNDYLMPSIITSFTRQYPAVRLQVNELSAEAIEAGLESGDLQVGLGFIPVTSDNIGVVYLLDERLVLVVREDHPLAVHSTLPVKALDQLPMVMLAQTFCTRHLWEANARLASAQPQVALELNTVSSILSVVLKTGLATVLPQFTLMEERASNLSSIDLHSPVPSRQVGLLWHRDRYLCSASRAFIETAQAAVIPFLTETVSPV